MMKKSSLLFVMVFLAAGCVNQTAVAPDRGLMIREFTITPSAVNSGEFVLLDLDIENIGGTNAENVQVDFFGVENQWRDNTGSPVTDTRTVDIGTLRPPEPTRNIPGQSRLIQDELITPEIRQGIVTTVSVEARATYDYDTNGFIDIPAISEDEFRRRQINNQPLEMPVTVTNSPGPIHMSMDTRFAPIRVDNTDDSTSEQVWPLRIVLTNVGDGFPITPEDDERIRGAGGRIEGTIRLTGSGAEFEDCLGETSGTEINLDSTDIALRIRETNEVSIPCTIRIDKDIWADRPVDTVKMDFQLFYRYYVRSTASVTVTGRNE